MSGETEVVTVPLDGLCVLIERAERLGIYGGTAPFDAYMAMPREVHERLTERAAERTKRLLETGATERAHREGKPHDIGCCVWCLTNEADMRRATAPPVSSVLPVGQVNP